MRRKFLDFPIYAEPTVAGRWTTNNFERNTSIGGDNNQVNVRADYNMSQNNRIIGRYTRFDSTNLPVDTYGNGQTNGDPYSPEHFITTQVMLADTYTLNSTTVLDVRFGLMRWDYDRTPGNLGTDPVSTFGLPWCLTDRFPSAATESRRPFRASMPARTRSSAPVSFTQTTIRIR